jgi:hypothetical protein
MSAESVTAKLLTNLFQQRRTGKFCDVKLHVGGSSWLWAHSSVLSIFSATLHKAFVRCPKYKLYNEWSLNDPIKIIVSDLPEVAIVFFKYSRYANVIYGFQSDGEDLECVECATKVINFCYNGRILIDSLDHVLHVEAFGRVLQVQELHSHCLDARIKIQQELQLGEAGESEVCSHPTDEKPAKGQPYACLGCGSKQRTAAALLQHLQHPDHDNSNLNCSLCLRLAS